MSRHRLPPFWKYRRNVTKTEKGRDGRRGPEALGAIAALCRHLELSLGLGGTARKPHAHENLTGAFNPGKRETAGRWVCHWHKSPSDFLFFFKCHRELAALAPGLLRRCLYCLHHSKP